jgi:hypothetical protein
MSSAQSGEGGVERETCSRHCNSLCPPPPPPKTHTHTHTCTHIQTISLSVSSLPPPRPTFARDCQPEGTSRLRAGSQTVQLTHVAATLLSPHPLYSVTTTTNGGALLCCASRAASTRQELTSTAESAWRLCTSMPFISLHTSTRHRSCPLCHERSLDTRHVTALRTSPHTNQRDTGVMRHSTLCTTELVMRCHGSILCGAFQQVATQPLHVRCVDHHSLHVTVIINTTGIVYNKMDFTTCSSLSSSPPSFSSTAANTTSSSSQ